MNASHSGTEKLNLLATALITALAVHALFAVAGVISTFGSPHGTFLLGLLKALRLIWNMAGFVAAGYLVFLAVGMINGRHYLQARTAAFGALFLPLLGSHGMVTAFALLPLGLAASYFLRQQGWQVLFVAGFPPIADTSEDVYSAGYSEAAESSAS